MNEQTSVLSFKEKASYFILNLGSVPIMVIMSSFLLLFYTDVVGLDPVAIGTLFLIARVMDGISDPIMGFFIDRLPPTKLGRFRGYIILGGALTCLSLLLIWLGPSMATTGKLAIAYISYLLFGWIYDLMDIPLNAMLPVMSDKEKDRSALSVLRGAGLVLGNVLVVAGVLPIVSRFPTQREGFHAVIIGVVVFIFVLSTLGTLGIKERIFPPNEQKYPFSHLFKIFTAKPVLNFFFTTILFQIGRGVGTGTLVYFFVYVLKRRDLFSYSALSSIVGILFAIVFLSPLVKRFGKKVTMAVILLISAVSALVQLVLPASMPMLFIIVPFIAAPAAGLYMTLIYSVQADLTDYIEWKQGYRAEGAVSSVYSFIIKAGQGVGSAVGAYLLAVFHYVPNAETQAAEAIQGLYVINFAVPGILLLLAALIWTLGYPLTKSITQQMNTELAAIRKSQAAGENPASK